jgi:hypothetical protein
MNKFFILWTLILLWGCGQRVEIDPNGCFEVLVEEGRHWSRAKKDRSTVKVDSISGMVSLHYPDSAQSRNYFDKWFGIYEEAPWSPLFNNGLHTQGARFATRYIAQDSILLALYISDDDTTADHVIIRPTNLEGESPTVMVGESFQISLDRSDTTVYRLVILTEGGQRYEATYPRTIEGRRRERFRGRWATAYSGGHPRSDVNISMKACSTYPHGWWVILKE